MNKFELGMTVMTNGVSEHITKNYLQAELLKIMERHVTGDWGNLPASDKKLNDEAVRTGENRIFSKYKLGEEDVYVITEWDRSVTTVLFPTEY